MIYDWPHERDFRPISGRFYPATVAQVSVSPYTGAGKGLTLAQIWKADVTFNTKSLEVAQDFQGFLDSLEGPVNPVRMFDWWREFPPLLAGDTTFFSDGTTFTDGTGFTDGASLKVVTAGTRGSRLLHVEGLPASQACFRRGDLVGLRHAIGSGDYIDCVYEVRGAVSSNADGEALVNILPGLRAGIDAGDPVTIWRPTMQMRLVPNQDAISRGQKWSEPFTLSFVEDVP
jgi:hypothetical protein